MKDSQISSWCSALQSGEIQAVCANSATEISRSESPTVASQTNERRLIFPGAFNPLHDGHRAMSDLAVDITGTAIEIEISIDNVDKPPLTPEEVVKRVQQFPPTQRVWLTRAMRFYEKAELFPAATFVVGADTIARIADPRYYAGDEEQRRTSIARITELGGRFLIFGRTRDGRFHTLAELGLPGDLSAICSGVARDQFDFDISSTDLRMATRQREK